MSLPLALGTDINSIPKRNSYLFSCKEKRHVWMSKLGEKRNPRIGLVWSGNSKHQNDHNRSIPLSELIRYLPDGFEYISLQREMRETDHQILCNSSIRYFGNDLSDFSDTAALCDLMDLIVSVDTSVAHLAGALGRPTWVLLPYRAEFRWLLDRDDSPWYPSCKLYRQSGVKRWDMVLDIVAEDLLKLFH
jgi:ADP-heptose:LPS heptosyltransferase